MLLADGQEGVRRGMRAHLECEPGFDVVAEAATGREAVAQALAYHPDLVLLDVHLPSGDGLWAITELARELPGVRVLILTASVDGAYLSEGLRAGAAGFVLKGCPPEELLHAIRGVAPGGRGVPGALTGRAVEAPSVPGGDASVAATALSPREREVVQLLARGASNRDISLVLEISENTVKAHLKAVARKLGLHSRVEAAGWALRYLADGSDD